MNGDRDFFDLDLSIAVLSQYNADGFLGIGLDVYGEQDAGTSTFEAHFPTGYYARPRDPSSTLGCAVLKGYNGNDLHCWPANDPRAIPKLPQVPKGSTLVFGDTGRTRIPFVYLNGDTGTVQVYAPHASSTTASTIAIDVSTEGAESIQMAHGAGMGLTMTAGGSYSTVIHNRLGNVYLEINDTQATINGNTQVNGSMIVGDIAQAWPVLLLNAQQLAVLAQLQLLVSALLPIAVNPTLIPDLTSFQALFATAFATMLSPAPAGSVSLYFKPS